VLRIEGPPTAKLQIDEASPGARTAGVSLRRKRGRRRVRRARVSVSG